MEENAGVEVARALAAQIGTQARMIRLDHHEESPAQAVLAGRCDAALGVMDDPTLVAAPGTPAGVLLTHPYYTVGYLLVRRPHGKRARTLRDVGEARLGVERESIAAYTLRQRGHRVHVLFNSAAVIRSVAERRLDYGYLWGPLAARLLGERHDVVVAGEFLPADQWNLTVAVREDGANLHHRLDEAIRVSLESGAIRRILAEYRLPLPPRQTSIKVRPI